MSPQSGWNISPKTIAIPASVALFFYSIAIWLYVETGGAFYLYNFGYIGTALSIGIFLGRALPKKHILWGRRIAQLLIGLYILGYVGFISKENMQIEGFFSYLLMGVFAGATLHYFLAKIVGPFIFNRGWCGWACWTAMVLDLLPWKKPQQGRLHFAGAIRYVHFAISLLLVLWFWFGLDKGYLLRQPDIELRWLVVGNVLYYIIGILLALLLRDNRAFCKYICPIPALLKLGARFSLMKVAIDDEKCTECGLCEKHCPMDIKLLEYKRAKQRVLSTECISCTTCMNVCPRSAIDMTFKFDVGGQEHLNFRVPGHFDQGNPDRHLRWP